MVFSLEIAEKEQRRCQNDGETERQRFTAWLGVDQLSLLVSLFMRAACH